jgi:hypothetical protein
LISLVSVRLERADSTVVEEEIVPVAEKVAEVVSAVDASPSREPLGLYDPSGSPFALFPALSLSNFPRPKSPLPVPWQRRDGFMSGGKILLSLSL